MFAYRQTEVLDSIRIEPSGVPIYVQIRDQVLSAIGAGAVHPGERMPTMRQVAVALRIDLNTVRHAYDELARAGVITVLPARGTFVAERPPPPEPAVAAARLDAFALQTIATAASNGLDPAEVARRILTLAAQRRTTDG